MKTWLCGCYCNRHAIWEKDGLQEEKVAPFLNLPVGCVCRLGTGWAVRLPNKSCFATSATWEAQRDASPRHYPERDMCGRRCLVSGGPRGSSSCCGLTSERRSSNFRSSFRTRWRKASLVMRRVKMTKSIYASSITFFILLSLIQNIYTQNYINFLYNHL